MTNDAHLLTPVGAALAAGQRIRLDDIDAFEVPDLSTPLPSAPTYRGANPFKKGPEFNLTEQMKLLRQNPKLAMALKDAAADA